MGLTYQVFPTRDEWLEARKRTIGASSLAHYIATGQLPSPPPNIPNIRSALRFGSIWEPMLVQIYADRLHLDLATKNTPVEQLENGQIAWYDNSFYTDGRLHASLDAAYRDHAGIIHTVEVKTGSQPAYTFLTRMQRDQYASQAQIEARMLGTDRAEIVYAQRPPDWETLTSSQIVEHVTDTLYGTIIPDVMSMEELERHATAYEHAMRPTANQGDLLLADLLEAKRRYGQARQRLAAWMAEHPDERVAYEGHVARMTAGTRTITDYATYFRQHPADLTPYRKTTTNSRLSIAKER